MLELLVAAGHEAGEHAYPTAFGFAPHGWTAIAMLVVFAIMLWAGVPRIIAGMLDSRIDSIRKQLDEASKLRAEAEALRDSYARKTAAADEEIAELRVGAQKQADMIVEKARVDAALLIERHKTVAAEKIATAERDAIADLRAQAATAAASAARNLIRENHSADADKALVNEAIGSI